MARNVLLYVLLLFPAWLNAQGLNKKTETLAIATFFVIAIAGIVAYWLVWKNKAKKPGAGGGKYKVKTVEVIRNGKKVVMTKKYREATKEEFPDNVKRKK